MIGIPALALAIVLAGTVVTWSRGAGETILAMLAAAVAFGTCLLLARVATGSPPCCSPPVVPARSAACSACC